VKAIDTFPARESPGEKTGTNTATKVSPLDRPALMRLERVARETGLSRTHIRALVRDGRFPKPIRIGLRAVAWSTSELFAWIEKRAGERDATTTEKSRPHLAPPAKPKRRGRMGGSL